MTLSPDSNPSPASEATPNYQNQPIAASNTATANLTNYDDNTYFECQIPTDIANQYAQLRVAPYSVSLDKDQAVIGSKRRHTSIDISTRSLQDGVAHGGAPLPDYLQKPDLLHYFVIEGVTDGIIPQTEVVANLLAIKPYPESAADYLDYLAENSHPIELRRHLINSELWESGELARTIDGDEQLVGKLVDFGRSLLQQPSLDYPLVKAFSDIALEMSADSTELNSVTCSLLSKAAEARAIKSTACLGEVAASRGIHSAKLANQLANAFYVNNNAINSSQRVEEMPVSLLAVYRCIGCIGEGTEHGLTDTVEGMLRAVHSTSAQRAPFMGKMSELAECYARLESDKPKALATLNELHTSIEKKTHRFPNAFAVLGAHATTTVESWLEIDPTFAHEVIIKTGELVVAKHYLSAMIHLAEGIIEAEAGSDLLSAEDIFAFLALCEHDDIDLTMSLLEKVNNPSDQIIDFVISLKNDRLIERLKEVANRESLPGSLAAMLALAKLQPEDAFPVLATSLSGERATGDVSRDAIRIYDRAFSLMPPKRQAELILEPLALNILSDRNFESAFTHHITEDGKHLTTQAVEGVVRALQYQLPEKRAGLLIRALQTNSAPYEAALKQFVHTDPSADLRHLSRFLESCDIGERQLASIYEIGKGLGQESLSFAYVLASKLVKPAVKKILADNTPRDEAEFYEDILAMLGEQAFAGVLETLPKQSDYRKKSGAALRVTIDSLVPVFTKMGRRGSLLLNQAYTSENGDTQYRAGLIIKAIEEKATN